jgi:hypothetical protein
MIGSGSTLPNALAGRRPLEREILLSGIGGQGIQLAAKSLAVAAMREGRRVLMFGTYGGQPSS